MIDSHCHLTSERFSVDAEPVMGQAVARGLSGAVTIGIGTDDAGRASDLCAAGGALPLWWTAGLDPSAAAEAGDAFLSELASIEALIASPRCCGLGEIGLEFHHDVAPLARQQGWLEAQLDLAGRMGKAVVIHARSGRHGDAHATIAPILAAFPRANGVIHSFDGDAMAARRYLDLGWSLAVNGMVTFKGNDALRKAVALVPDDRLLLETDAPYLAPVPHRGKRNDPSLLPVIGAAVAVVRNQPFADVWRRAGRNATRVFSLPIVVD